MTGPISSSLNTSGINPIPMPDAGLSTSGSGSGAFQQVLQSSISELQSLQDNANSSVQQFVTGQNEELHTIALASQRAELAFELGLQIRNKVVSAYQEVMKMQL